MKLHSREQFEARPGSPHPRQEEGVFLPFIYTGMDLACLKQAQMISATKRNTSDSDVPLKNPEMEQMKSVRRWSFDDENAAVARQ